jgi:hypothetical protein
VLCDLQLAAPGGQFCFRYQEFNLKERKEEGINHEGTKLTKFMRMNIRALRVLRAFVVKPYWIFNSLF